MIRDLNQSMKMHLLSELRKDWSAQVIRQNKRLMDGEKKLKNQLKNQ